MPLFHRRALIAALPTKADRRAARSAYKQSVAELGASSIILFLVAFVCVYSYHSFIDSHDQPPGLFISERSRLLAATTAGNASNTTTSVPTAATKQATIGPPNFPNYWISPYANGGTIVYILGMIYTFMGLAVVCDEFFVPALEIMIDTFEISDDVAGATLMAVRPYLLSVDYLLVIVLVVFFFPIHRPTDFFNTCIYPKTFSLSLSLSRSLSLFYFFPHPTRLVVLHLN